MYLLSESPCAHVSWQRKDDGPSCSYYISHMFEMHVYEPSREGRSCDIYGAGVGGGLAWDTSPPRAMNRAATPLSRSVNVTPMGRGLPSPCPPDGVCMAQKGQGERISSGQRCAPRTLSAALSYQICPRLSWEWLPQRRHRPAATTSPRAGAGIR